MVDQPIDRRSICYKVNQNLFTLPQDVLVEGQGRGGGARLLMLLLLWGLLLGRRRLLALVVHAGTWEACEFMNKASRFDPSGPKVSALRSNRIPHVCTGGRICTLGAHTDAPPEIWPPCPAGAGRCLDAPSRGIVRRLAFGGIDGGGDWVSQGYALARARRPSGRATGRAGLTSALSS